MASPIFKIPNELLGKIFTHVPDFIDSHLSEINRLTLVCKLWRQVAISSPSIWLHIPLDSPRRTDLYLRRSKNALLYVDELCSVPSTHSIQLVLTQLHRIKILRLTFREQSSLLLQALSHNADAPSGHLLQHLDIRFYSSARQNSTLARTLPPHFLSARLVTLALEGADLPTKLPILGSLARLTLRYPPVHQSWDDFAAIFRATPALRELSLNGRGSAVSNAFTPHSAGAIRLPHLSDLHLNRVYPPAHCAAMLDQIEYPSDIQPRIEMPTISGFDFTPLFKHCSYLGPQSRLEQSLSTSLTVSYAGSCFDVSLATKTSNPLFRVHGSVKYDKVSSVLESTCASLNLAQVRDLSIDIKVPLRLPLDRCLPPRLLTNVQTMLVSHRLTDVTVFLNPQSPRVVPNQSWSDIPFPRLEHLMLRHCSLTDDDIEHLAGIFSGRRHLGCGPPQITILEDPGCNDLSRQSFALLQAQSAVTLDPDPFSDDLSEALGAPPSKVPLPCKLSPLPSAMESFCVSKAAPLRSPTTCLNQALSDPHIHVPSPQSYADDHAAMRGSHGIPMPSKSTQNPSLVNVIVNHPSVEPRFLRVTPLLTIKLPHPLIQ